MINFGKYDQKISFISFQEVEDEFGGYVPTVCTVLTTFAAVRQIKGSNNLEAFQLELPKMYEFRVQHRDCFEPNQTMQIIYRGQNYAIKSVLESEERNTREWQLMGTKI